MATAIGFGIIVGSLAAISFLCWLGIRFLDWYERRKPKTERRFIPRGCLVEMIALARKDEGESV
ncbi:MAG: hypothetical protein Q7S16_05225 [bacterium]|nr:hypothetical protein [bacterium]